MPNSHGRVATTIFCDDIRLELGNKLSLMGVYQGQLVVPSAPLLLPKLCIYLTISGPAETPFRSLKIRFLKDQELIYEQPIDASALPEVQTPVREMESDPSNHLQTFVTTLVMSPFVIDKPFILRVRVDADGDEMKAPGLMIVVGSQSPTSQP